MSSQWSSLLSPISFSSYFSVNVHNYTTCVYYSANVGVWAVFLITLSWFDVYSKLIYQYTRNVKYLHQCVLAIWEWENNIIFPNMVMGNTKKSIIFLFLLHRNIRLDFLLHIAVWREGEEKTSFHIIGRMDFSQMRCCVNVRPSYKVWAYRSSPSSLSCEPQLPLPLSFCVIFLITCMFLLLRF